MAALSPHDAHAKPVRLSRADAWGLLGVVLTASLVFLPVLWTGFAGDDYFILARLQTLGGLAHPGVYFTQDFFQYYRPLTFVSQAVDWELWGRQPFGYHLTSLVLHAANSILVFLLARRLTGRAAAVIAGVLFATHPAAHETVYWMAARFDLLATCLSLASLLLLTDGRGMRYGIGVVVFALAMLSKESALAVPALVVGYDVFVDRRSLRDCVRRLVPLVLVMAAYSGTRALATELAGDDARRLPKLIVLAAAMVGMLVVAWRRVDGSRLSARVEGTMRIGLIGGAAAMAVLLATPPTAMWMAERLGFVAYAAFYLLSPVIFPGPRPETFTPIAPAQAIPGLVALLIVLAVLWWARRRVAEDRVSAYSLAFVAASLIPVMSLTGSSRYVYIATAGLAMLVGHLVTQSAPSGPRPYVTVALAAYVTVSVAQLAVAAASWRWGSAMVRDGIALMSRDLAPCGTKDIVMLTAPVGIRNMYSNFYWDMFQVEGCTPVSISAVLRVVRDDAHVEVRRTGARDLEIRVAAYRGNVVLAEDLRHFDLPVSTGDRRTIRLPIGELATRPDGSDQLFALTLNEQAERMLFFYYSDGAMHEAP